MSDFPTGHLLVFNASDRWSGAIRSGLAEYAENDQIRMATFALKEFDEATSLYPRRLCAIDFTTHEDAEFQRVLCDIWPQLYGAPVFCLGDYRFEYHSIDIKATGFCECFWSTSQVRRLVSLASNHFANSVSPEAELEQLVSRDLPWTPIKGE